MFTDTDNPQHAIPFSASSLDEDFIVWQPSPQLAWSLYERFLVWGVATPMSVMYHHAFRPLVSRTYTTGMVDYHGAKSQPFELAWCDFSSGRCGSDHSLH